MEKIRTVEALVRKFESTKNNPAKVLQIMKMADIPRAEFEKYYSWDDNRNARNVLARNEDFEILLICWERGQASPIHDFNSQEAWVHPVQGWLKEERYKINPGDDIKLEKVSSVLLGTDEYSYMKHVDIHRYSNAHDARSVSLNIYRKPVKEWRVYDELTSNSEVRRTWENKNFNLLEANEAIGT